MELLRALAVIAEAPSPEALRLASVLGLPGTLDATDHTDLFVFQLPPYASVYTGAEGRIGGEARDRVAGFWRALGLTVPSEPDHLAALLGLYAALTDHEAVEAGETRRSALRTARHALFWEHLASWLPVYLAQASRVGSTAYAAWATLLDATLNDEARALGEPSALPGHLQAAPPLPSHDEGADEWLGALLAPVRAGFIVARADLARCAGAVGLALRAGERRFALRALLEQDIEATLRWLEAEARTRAASTSDDQGPGTAIRQWWADRALATADALHGRPTKETIHA